MNRRRYFYHLLNSILTSRMNGFAEYGLFTELYFHHSDGKVCGEIVSYDHGGGDIHGPWHGHHSSVQTSLNHPDLKN